MTRVNTQFLTLGADAFLEEFLAWSRDGVLGLGLDDTDVSALEKYVREHVCDNTRPGDVMLEDLLEWARDSIGGLGLDGHQVAALEKRVHSGALASESTSLEGI